MTVRVRYRASELGEGADTDYFTEANSYKVLDDNTLELRWVDPETRKVQKVGLVHPDRWDSCVVEDEDEDVLADDQDTAGPDSPS
jgi:hypothetical protein